MAANMGNGQDGGKERKKPHHHYRRSGLYPKPHPQNSLVVPDRNFRELLENITTFLRDLRFIQEKNIYKKRIQENVSFLYSEQLNRDPQLAMPSVYRKCLLKLCHDMLWIEYHYSEQGAKFFKQAMDYLKRECGSHLNENPEYQYLLKLEEIKNNHCDLYEPFRKFETTFVQDVEFIGEDKAKVYEAANIQMDKILNPSGSEEEGEATSDEKFDRLCAELSPKSRDKKIATVLTCLKGLAVSVLGLGMQGLGLALIGFSFVSASGGLSLPVSLLGIGAGLGLFFLGSKVLEEGFAICSGAFKAQDSRERLCEGLGTLRRPLIGVEELSASSHQGNLSDSSDPAKHHSENGGWTWSLPSPLSWFRRLPNPFERLPNPFGR